MKCSRILFIETFVNNGALISRSLHMLLFAGSPSYVRGTFMRLRSRSVIKFRGH